MVAAGVGELAAAPSPRRKAESFLAALAGSGGEILDRICTAIVVAHPDDETIGFAGQFRRVANLLVVHVTDGAPRDALDAIAAGYPGWESYAAARERELDLAMGEAGIDCRRRAGL